VEEKSVIVIYEKEIKLNQILKEQLSIKDIYQIHEATDEKDLIELIETLTINILILNLNHISEEFMNIFERYNLNNKVTKLLGYYDRNHSYLNMTEKQITLLEKPFKVSHLFSELENLLSTNTYQNSDIFLMNNLKFLPYEKVLINLNSKNKEHLTEKENKLLLHFYSNKNIEITKNDLLSSIWGISENVNTHTLETHIYRLKQKLHKLEPKSSFLLSNNNGLYRFQF
tara:strand:+ start:634 stop:1317 length:684 start_codon:yes stop_codon:yes gene_type:complete